MLKLEKDAPQKSSLNSHQAKATQQTILIFVERTIFLVAPYLRKTKQIHSTIKKINLLLQLKTAIIKIEGSWKVKKGEYLGSF